ncbi:DUF1883 domain-containing protein (plasmid) [Cedecea neteri]|uniref:DUF1883 domain-containing protein n=2 Tax=Cedecea neteri TaxID=158822 RepID=A0A291E5N1_9ENTR|nr:DUF1883 domain-containing protein [Cedecea neteri]
MKVEVMTYKRLYAKAGNYIIVNSNMPLIIMIRDDHNHEIYLKEGGANFYGGFFNHFPALIQISATGYWNITVKRWGFLPDNIEYSVELFQESVRDECKLPVQ